MPAYQKHLDWIASQQKTMVSLLEQWAAINSGSDNLSGLSAMADALEREFASLNATSYHRIALNPRRLINSKGEWKEVPLGEALFWQKNSNAPLRVFLGGHMDTVFSAESTFQKTERLGANTMQGPGVTDMKGGLVVMLTALRAFEQSPYAHSIGWDILINPDEEIGSPGSGPLFETCAKHNTIGLLFEPSYSDGSFVSSRKGSSNWTAVAKGRSAHAGRDFHKGRNAITALAKFLLQVELLNNPEKEITVNIGHLEGGGPINIVPDSALGKFNIRIVEPNDLENLTLMINKLAEEASREEGIEIAVHADTRNPPKPFDSKTESLFKVIKECASQLGMEMRWRPSGGACDGCRLHAAGLPNMDTLGVIGGNIHTYEEYIELDSLVQRAQLTSLFLMLLASGEMKL